MASAHGQFSSKFGFIMAASGSAVGLGNIWGFPTQAAGGGGGAFVLVYLLLALLLAYPALMAELTLGRYGQCDVVKAYSAISPKHSLRILGRGVGGAAVLVASLIFSFYAIVSGWLCAHFAASVMRLLGFPETLDQWLVSDSIARNLLVTALFSWLSIWIVTSGVVQGVEKWSSRLMPVFALLLVALILYVLSQPGALAGLKVYLFPDPDRLTEPSLIVDAMGQAFFSLSLGVGTMVVYGSYLSRQENLPQAGMLVMLVDVGIAFAAGLLIIPAMFVAQRLGTEIFNDQGQLIAGPTLIFQILPSLFASMGVAGLIIAPVFFALLVIAALTSSISMLEVSVSLVTANTAVKRSKAAYIIGLAIFTVSSVIIFNFNTLFGLVVDLTTKYSQPLIGLASCIFAGWILQRNKLLRELQQGNPNIESSLFWKIWPWYIRTVCPLLIVAAFAQSLL